MISYRMLSNSLVSVSLAFGFTLFRDPTHIRKVALSSFYNAIIIRISTYTRIMKYKGIWFLSVLALRVIFGENSVLT